VNTHAINYRHICNRPWWIRRRTRNRSPRSREPWRWRDLHLDRVRKRRWNLQRCSPKHTFRSDKLSWVKREFPE